VRFRAWGKGGKEETYVGENWGEVGEYEGDVGEYFGDVTLPACWGLVGLQFGELGL
jgi:hypothetical protein